MKALKVLGGALALMAGTQAVAGGSLDISLSDDTARLEYDAAKVGSGLHVSISGQHNETDGNLIGLGAHVVDVRKPNSPLYLGVGGKLFAYSNDDFDGGALGVGGFFRYRLPSLSDVSLAGYVYYAPKVVSFNDTDNLADMDLRLQYSLIPTARVYTGYRYSRVKVEGVRRVQELDQGFHFGLKVDF